MTILNVLIGMKLYPTPYAMELAKAVQLALSLHRVHQADPSKLIQMPARQAQLALELVDPFKEMLTSKSGRTHVLVLVVFAVILEIMQDLSLALKFKFES